MTPPHTPPHDHTAGHRHVTGEHADDGAPEALAA